MNNNNLDTKIEINKSKSEPELIEVLSEKSNEDFNDTKDTNLELVNGTKSKLK